MSTTKLPLLLSALLLSGCGLAEGIQSTPTPTLTSAPTVTATATILPTSTATPWPTPWVVDPPSSTAWPTTVPVPGTKIKSFPWYIDESPYKLVAPHPGHDAELAIVREAANNWEAASGLDLFQDDGAVINVYFEGDTECSRWDGQEWQPGIYGSTAHGAIPPGYSADLSSYPGVAGMVFLCIKEFFDNGCIVSSEHELGHILGLDEDRRVDDGQVRGVMASSYTPGHTYTFEEWCYQTYISPDEANAVYSLHNNR